MCGIAGIVNRDAKPAEPAELWRMIGCLSHRGPDELAVKCQERAGFAHARLSIIDLSGGRQPMESGDGNLCITFNGEIFNYLELRENLTRDGHRFATRSDTEVILHMYEKYGTNCVQYLNGQWSFAIWDKKRRRLFASRDRFGVRPFFYARTPNAFLFASEIKALFVHPEVPHELNLAALNQIFTFWFTLPPETAFRGINELPPGHSLVLQDNELEIHRYWQLSYNPCAQGGNDLAQAKSDELLELLTDAVRIRLRADVPVGAYLSGGLDSTLTTALIRRVHGGKLKTFSICFSDAEYDESIFQRQASAFLGTEHQELRCTYESIADAFPDVVRHAETPLLRTAPVPLFLLSDLVRKNGFKVVITGEGADEIFGGYDIFKEAKVRRFWAAIPDSRIRPLLLKRLYPYMKSLQSQSTAYLKPFFHVSAHDSASPFFSHLPRWNLTARTKQFFSSEVKLELEKDDPYERLTAQLPRDFGSWPFFCQSQYLETAYLLPGYILSSQGDRMAMAHSVEARHPFLDYRVVEFAAKLPPNLKMKVLNEKYLLRKMAKGLVPDSVCRRPKQPYRAPDGRSFFRTKSPADVIDALSQDRLRQDNIFDPSAVSRLVQKFRSGAALGVKDDMAMVGILSTQLVVTNFIGTTRKEYATT
jgi:asparagine synthase (glutamine-hydrolysing)